MEYILASVHQLLTRVTDDQELHQHAYNHEAISHHFVRLMQHVSDLEDS